MTRRCVLASTKRADSGLATEMSAIICALRSVQSMSPRASESSPSLWERRAMARAAGASAKTKRCLERGGCIGVQERVAHSLVDVATPARPMVRHQTLGQLRARLGQSSQPAGGAHRRSTVPPSAGTAHAGARQRPQQCEEPDRRARVQQGQTASPIARATTPGGMTHCATQHTDCGLNTPFL